MRNILLVATRIRNLMPETPERNDYLLDLERRASYMAPEAQSDLWRGLCKWLFTELKLGVGNSSPFIYNEDEIWKARCLSTFMGRSIEDLTQNGLIEFISG